MIFFIHQGGGSHVKSDNTHIIINIHHLAHILDICALIFSSCALFSLSQPHHVTASHPSLGDKPPEHGSAVRKNAGPSKNGRVKLIRLHTYQCSPLFRSLTRSPYRNSPVAKATFTLLLL